MPSCSFDAFYNYFNVIKTDGFNFLRLSNLLFLLHPFACCGIILINCINLGNKKATPTKNSPVNHQLGSVMLLTIASIFYYSSIKNTNMINILLTKY